MPFSFNEATAISCGDLGGHRERAARGCASTRPQRLAVEIFGLLIAWYVLWLGFNEATAISCGDLRSGSTRSASR